MPKRKSVALADLVAERWVPRTASALLAVAIAAAAFEEHGLPAPQFALVSDSGVLNRRMVASLNVLGIAPKAERGAWMRTISA